MGRLKVENDWSWHHLSATDWRTNRATVRSWWTFCTTVINRESIEASERPTSAVHYAHVRSDRPVARSNGMSELPHTPSMDLSGKIALVTGASSGIGLGCAVALAEAGAHIVCAARRAGVLEQAVAAMQSAGFSAEAMPLDQTDIVAVYSACQTPFDIVVNSAGFARHSAAVDTVEQDFDAVFDINVKGAFFLSCAAARALIKAGKPGSIIHISSQMGHVGGDRRAVYAATKHAVEGMVKSMAIEWGKSGIRINSISPTFIRTPLTKPTFDDPEQFAWIMGKIKLPRPGEVSDIMGAVRFLASDASAMMTGTSMLIDGGWTAD